MAGDQPALQKDNKENSPEAAEQIRGRPIKFHEIGERGRRTGATAPKNATYDQDGMPENVEAWFSDVSDELTKDSEAAPGKIMTPRQGTRDSEISTPQRSEQRPGVANIPAVSPETPVPIPNAASRMPRQSMMPHQFDHNSRSIPTTPVKFSQISNSSVFDESPKATLSPLRNSHSKALKSSRKTPKSGGAKLRSKESPFAKSKTTECPSTTEKKAHPLNQAAYDYPEEYEEVGSAQFTDLDAEDRNSTPEKPDAGIQKQSDSKKRKTYAGSNSEAEAGEQTPKKRASGKQPPQPTPQIAISLAETTASSSTIGAELMETLAEIDVSFANGRALEPSTTVWNADPSLDEYSESPSENQARRARQRVVVEIPVPIKSIAERLAVAQSEPKQKQQPQDAAHASQNGSKSQEHSEESHLLAGRASEDEELDGGGSGAEEVDNADKVDNADEIDGAHSASLSESGEHHPGDKTSAGGEEDQASDNVEMEDDAYDGTEEASPQAGSESEDPETERATNSPEATDTEVTKNRRAVSESNIDSDNEAQHSEHGEYPPPAPSQKVRSTKPTTAAKDTEVTTKKRSAVPKSDTESDDEGQDSDHEGTPPPVPSRQARATKGKSAAIDTEVTTKKRRTVPKSDTESDTESDDEAQDSEPQDQPSPGPSRKARVTKAKSVPKAAASKSAPAKRVAKPRGGVRKPDPPAALEGDNKDDNGCRRSRRMKISPLKFWAGERVVVGRRESGFYPVPVVKEVIRIDSEEEDADRQKARARAARVKREKRAQAFVEPNIPVINIDTGVEEEQHIISTPAMLDLRPTGGSYKFQKVFSEGTFIASGVLVFPKGSKKPNSNTKRSAMIFMVMSGEVEVQVHKTQFVVYTGTQFLIPRGNQYCIANRSNREARLFFCHGKEVEVAATETNEVEVSPPATETA
ncbi:hypothetical protein HDU87_002313 [Geranomyces variabilis]|uniref:CENP-C homolog n=1 Tax=Geranomyces variabilis TaxID=109894 RepID=A0AAD5XNE3_9FUNG|nr:hypothetical protein HDU87_002313 [Geranomyces variabilis]